MQYSTSIRKHSEKNKERAIIFFFFLLIVGVSLQVIRVIIWSKVNREAALRKSNKILVEHENNLKRYENKTFKEKLEIFEKLMAEKFKDDK